MRKVIVRNVGFALGLLMLMFSYQNCGQIQNTVSFGSIKPPAPESVVCGGFDSEQNQTQNYGIIGNIFVSNQTDNPGSATKYATDAAPLKTAAGDLVTIYVNNVDVPTRAFTEGFVNQTGNALTDADGNVLIEYFGLKLRYVLRLPDDYEPGFYQIGIESDDGAVLKTLDTNNEMKEFINNDGQHATAAKCASKALYFDHSTQIPSELYYFQGPRQHIAMRLFWKKVDQESVSASCGTIGAADGTPASNNWKIIPSTAFDLPPTEILNPCAN